MKIIDAQIHIWSQTVVPTSGLHRKVETFTAEEVLKEMDEAGVDAALIHPPAGWDSNANAVAIEAVKKYPGRFAIMGNFPLQNPDNRKLIHGWRNQPGMMGLRWPLLLEEHQKWLHDGSLDWLWPAVEQEGLPIAMMGGLFLKKFGEIAEQPADTDVLGLFGGLDVEPLRFEFHRLDFLADGVERQVLGQPDRAALEETLDVLAADRRQMLAEALLVHFEQAMAMAALFLGHLLEDFCRVRVTLSEVFREGHVDAAVLLLGGDRDRQHLALAEFGESLHWKIQFRIILNY